MRLLKKGRAFEQGLHPALPEGWRLSGRRAAVFAVRGARADELLHAMAPRTQAPSPLRVTLH